MENSDARCEMQSSSRNRPNAKWRGICEENGRDKCFAKLTGDDNNDPPTITKPKSNKLMRTFCVCVLCVYVCVHFAPKTVNLQPNETKWMQMRGIQSEKKYPRAVDGHRLRLTGIWSDAHFPPATPNAKAEKRKIKQKANREEPAELERRCEQISNELISDALFGIEFQFDK